MPDASPQQSRILQPSTRQSEAGDQSAAGRLTKTKPMTDDALAAVLSLMSEAVIAFDGSGRVLLANEAAQGVWGLSRASLMGLSVRQLFLGCDGRPVEAPDVVAPAPSPEGEKGAGPVPTLAFDLGELPFSLDGQSCSAFARRSDGASFQVNLRCERISAATPDLFGSALRDAAVQGPSATTVRYVLVAREHSEELASDREHERLVEELSRSNRRLSGTLSIVLATLDSEDVMTLFSRVLDEIASTMEATGTIFYVAGSDGYHLRGTSTGLDCPHLARFMSFDRTIDKLTTQQGHALRLRALSPDPEALRQGRLTHREVMDEETGETYQVRVEHMPPFASFIAVPVWFGSHVIAMIEVGWGRMHPTRREDAELLDAVAQYLSVQLVGAFSAMREQREQSLQEASSRIREMLMSQGDVDEEGMALALDDAAATVGAAFVPAELATDGSLMAQVTLPTGALCELDLSSHLSAKGHSDASVVTIDEGSELSCELGREGGPCVGVVVDLGRIEGIRRVFLLLRDADDEPLDELELAFVGRVAEGVKGLAQGGEVRRQQKHIAQALQTGMKNELQDVVGISASGIYSSATQAAVIGGDFYDLIRLPDNRACVIMGDVSGKGVEAASVSAAVKTALGAYSWQGLPPSRMVRLLNEFLLGFSRLETFATLFVGMIDLVTSRITYCSAGHPPAMMVRAKTAEVEALNVQSGVVGAFHDMGYHDGIARFDTGDMLLLYTDGTTEARAIDGSFFGEDGLRDAVVREWALGFEGVLDRLLGDLDVFTDRHLEDDVAMVALRFDGLPDSPQPAATQSDSSQLDSSQPAVSQPGSGQSA
ncbi:MULTISPECIES: GAF domain-containing SpoIIE family protein phosphatase [Atopobiaceae]|uniref:Stage II sporulation protein E (SpoIIE) n=1 Tax=Parafannyhessea umbonata TaxID=604330 RepID=A0A1H6I8D4_9ACTN|nr:MULTISPECIES: SpoIIE family protein phosphatase [Atopobiaceae]SEH44845.1 Stage II sporulation protein E (SpoIIE) [Parafannyhessea umbonata]SJZ61192.1 Stage II sporulation protein E (SpoIIE) [Olsenella sp. KH1P3]